MPAKECSGSRECLLYLYSELRKSVMQVMKGNGVLTCGFRDCLSVICTDVKTGPRESLFCSKTSNFQQVRAVGLVLSLLGFGFFFPRDSSVLPQFHMDTFPFLGSTVLWAASTENCGHGHEPELIQRTCTILIFKGSECYPFLWL